MLTYSDFVFLPKQTTKGIQRAFMHDRM